MININNKHICSSVVPPLPPRAAAQALHQEGLLLPAAQQLGGGSSSCQGSADSCKGERAERCKGRYKCLNRKVFYLHNAYNILFFVDCWDSGDCQKFWDFQDRLQPSCGPWSPGEQQQGWRVAASGEEEPCSSGSIVLGGDPVPGEGRQIRRGKLGHSSRWYCR